MRMKGIGVKGFITGCVGLTILLLSGSAYAKLVPARDPRAGVLDSSLIVLVKEERESFFQVEEVFLGDGNVGDVISLPGFRLFTYQNYGADLVEPITPDTRILLFLQPAKDEPGKYEVTAYGYCFFWVHDLNKVDDLRKIANDAVALRKAWETARDNPDGEARVKALWPYLWEPQGYFYQHTHEELQKAGVIAGDFIASQFEALDIDQRAMIIRDLGLIGGEKLHEVLASYMRTQQTSFEKFLVKPLSKKAYEKYNSEVPDRTLDTDGELFYALEGLASFKQAVDLPYIRRLALWAVNYQMEQTCAAALEVFHDWPDQENLAVIAAIAKKFSPHSQDISPRDITRCLESHHYVDAMPLLVALLEDKEAGGDAREILSGIVGKDLGAKPKPWLDWYRSQKSPK